MASRRTSPRKRTSSQASVAYPPDAFFAPLFKDRSKKMAKFVKWINSSSIEDITKILVTMNETLLSSDATASSSSDKWSKKLEIIVLADIVQCGYRNYGLFNASDSDRKYQKELQLLGIASDDVIAMMIKLIKKIYKNRFVKIAMDESDVSYPHFQNLRWRLDVTISNSNLKRVLKPCLVLSITLSDGRIKYMECSVDKFHELRFNVSRVLREMQVLQQRFIDHDDSNHTSGALQEESQYVTKYKKLASIAGINNLSQIANSNAEETKTEQ
eukprot:358032_1